MDHPPIGPRIGIDASGTRTETDSMGAVEVPADRYWGAQTQRSCTISPSARTACRWRCIRAFGIVKKAAALVNRALAGCRGEGRADRAGGRRGHRRQARRAVPAVRVADRLRTQTNMNVNEVISNRAIQLAGGSWAARSRCIPNDHVNMSQSSNDTFPTAMHIATVTSVRRRCCRRCDGSGGGVRDEGRREWDGHREDRPHPPAGRHAADRGAGMVGLCAPVRGDRARRASRRWFYELAAGGTAVGTGINAPAGFSDAHRANGSPR